MTAELQRFKQLIAKVATGARLDQAEAGEAFELMMSGNATPAQVAGLLMALRVRGETVEELTAGATSLRERMTRITAPADAVDTCGTGGDAAGTHNISTATAIVVAGAGVPVAKHGNRGLSSRSGSAEVLTQLGVNIEAELPLVERAIREAGIGFMMAPRHHGAMRHVAGPRVELGTRTIFNLLGPLANPAGVRRQVIGVGRADLVLPMAEVLAALGAERAWVVHGPDGIDELGLAGCSDVAEVDGGAVRRHRVDPTSLGLSAAPLEALRVRDADDAVAAVRERRDGGEGTSREVVCQHNAAALVVGGLAGDLRAGVAAAAAAIDDGAATRLLARLVAVSREEAAR